MVGGIGDTTLASIPGIDLGAGAGTSQQQQQQGRRSTAGGDTLTFSPEAQQHISKLQQRDREVRSHEQSHISAGGSHVNGGASYTYQRGPDNKQYAVGGSVSIDTSPYRATPKPPRKKPDACVARPWPPAILPRKTKAWLPQPLTLKCRRSRTLKSNPQQAQKRPLPPHKIRRSNFLVLQGRFAPQTMPPVPQPPIKACISNRSCPHNWHHGAQVLPSRYRLMIPLFLVW